MGDTADTKRQVDDDVLGSYLHSHVIAAQSGKRLIEQAAKAWQGTPYGPTMDRLAQEITEDSEELNQIVESLGLKLPAHKQAIAWAGEQASKLDPLNPGHAHGHNMQLELESLISAVTGKSLLWETLRLVSEEDGRIDAAQMDGLHRRALNQINDLSGVMRSTAKARFRGEEVTDP